MTNPDKIAAAKDEVVNAADGLREAIAKSPRSLGGGRGVAWLTAHVAPACRRFDAAYARLDALTEKADD